MTTSTAEPRIAFFITSYGSGDQLLRLVKTLRAAEPESPVIIHHDSFQRELSPSLFNALSDIHFFSSEEPIGWGDMTLEAARWRVFRWILNHLDVDWIMLLSEQDYPVAPLPVLRRRLSDTTADAIIAGERIDKICDEGLRHECDLRYMYRYYSVPNLGIERRLPLNWQTRLARLRGLLLTAVTRYQRWLSFYRLPAGMRIGFRQRRTPFSDNFPCWKNDCWFALSRNAMQHVVNYIDRNPGFGRYYRRTIIPLESATATILFNAANMEIENEALHAIRWTDPQSGRPDIFTSADFEYLISSGAAFARKFGSEDIAVLEQLDSVILYEAEKKI